MNCYMVSDGDYCLGYAFANDAGIACELAQDANADLDVIGKFDAYYTGELYAKQYLFGKRPDACFIDTTENGDQKHIATLRKLGLCKGGRFFNRKQG